MWGSARSGNRHLSSCSLAALLGCFITWTYSGHLNAYHPPLFPFFRRAFFVRVTWEESIIFDNCYRKKSRDEGNIHHLEILRFQALGFLLPQTFRNFGRLKKEIYIYIYIYIFFSRQKWATSMSAESVLGRKLFWYGLAIIGEVSYHISVYHINEIWGAFKDYVLIYFSLNSLPVNLSQTWIKWVLNLSKWFKNYIDTCVFKRQNLFLELAGAIHVK